MSKRISDFHNRPEIWSLVSGVEAGALAADLGGAPDHRSSDTAPDELRVAAMMALTEVIGHRSVESLIRSLAASDDAADLAEGGAFEKWDAYLTALEVRGETPDLDELVFYCASGLLARQQVEVRSTLRALGQAEFGAQSSNRGWSGRVRDSISSALILTVRQTSRRDLAAAMEAIQELAEEQRSLEAEWLDSRMHPATDAIGLLGYYHLARAIARTSEFLREGSVASEAGAVSDVGPELRRLLSRADEYLGLSADVETQFWLNAVAVLLWTLRTDSVWISGRGISERLDRLLDELAQGQRERNVFSLLPSQQDAIRGSLMDASKVAIVLQMPTSSGKTLLAEFAILQTLDAFKEHARVVYLVPTRALATQTFRTLSEDLGPLGIDVMAAASAIEEDPYELELLRATSGVIVATPEKLDLLLRSHPEWFEQLRLVVVDEAHLLSESERGVRLELLLATIRRERPEARLLLMTPFVKNAKAIATWLGGARGLPITVQWRPVRLLLGLAEVIGSRRTTRFVTRWREPYRPSAPEKTVTIPAGVNKSALASTKDRVTHLADKLGGLGSVLALYSGSKRGPELAAARAAEGREALPESQRTATLRVAIALAEDEFGEGAPLPECLKRGVAYHHAALSPTLRYLIEDQVRSGTVKVIAATTTLAQGMNFPVASVIVHSVHKPYGKGALSSSEFWNIAGRAGRAGMVEKGLVLFANQEHRDHWLRYANDLSAHLRSSLLDILTSIGLPGATLKEQYRRHEELRPFIQYLAHAAASSSPEEALDELDELLQGSLANSQVASEGEAQVLQRVARQYLAELTGTQPGLLRAADRVGLGSFSFNELYAKIRADAILRAGPRALVDRREAGLVALVEALRWLPELDLALGKGTGDMDVEAVARVVQGWMDGRRIVDLAAEFPGSDKDDQVRNAGAYLFSKVSQTVAWGAHAYLRGWGIGQPKDSEWESTEDAMLPAYIQHGVHTPEAAVASLLSIPRQLAEPIGGVYRELYGRLQPAEAGRLRKFVENADVQVWQAAVERSNLQVSAADVRSVWRQMRGLER